MSHKLFFFRDILKLPCCQLFFWLLFLPVSAVGLPQDIANTTANKPIPQKRIVGDIDDNNRVTLTGNRSPRIHKSDDLGRIDDSLAVKHMIMTLSATPAQNKALEQRLAAMQDTRSAEFGKWLTPDEFEQQYGVAEQDINTIVQWLSQHGFSVDEIPAGRRSIVFSGSVESIRKAFHADIHRYRYKGKLHIANSSDPEIPDALSGVVSGIVSLHDFRSMPLSLKTKLGSSYTAGDGSHAMSPADFYTIYNLNPVATQSINGAGSSIAILGRTNIVMADIQQFQNAMGLPANLPQIILNGADPGRVAGDEGESDLDLEWAGAVAPNASIKFVTTKSTVTTDGIDASAQYAVSNNVADVISLSYGLCEADLGSSAVNFYNNLWLQASAQGMTVFVSSGDSGAADCDGGTATTATRGRAVNGLCTSPYSTCVGGTQFNDNANPGLYWTGSNNAGNLSSALSYIPEVVWNESGNAPGGSGLWASGGGASSVFTKPVWQTGLGIPTDGRRDVPDVSLNAALHDGYLVYSSDGATSPTRYVFGGTSASAPSFAGMMALINQKTGYRQGNANPRFYQLAALQVSGGPPIFHQITAGNNSVPGATGFSASSASFYNQATGLGSVDGNVLVNHWTDALPASNTTVTANLSTSSLGQNVTFAATITGNMPTGSVQFKDGTSNLGGAITLMNGLATMSSGTLAIGSHAITAVYSGDVNNNASVSPDFNLTVNQVPTAVALSSSSVLTNFGQSVTFSARITGRSPRGTLQFMDGSSSLGLINVTGCVNTFTLSNLAAGSHTITAIYSGDASNLGSSSQEISLTVMAVSDIQIDISPAAPHIGSLVKVTAHVNGASPTGTVQFSDGNNPLDVPVALLNGIASLNVSSFSLGNHSISANYSGDATNTPGSAGPIVVGVLPVVSSLTLSSSNLNAIQGNVLSLMAYVSGYAPTGQVEFFDGGASLGLADIIDGVATLNTSALNVGNHEITAMYAGDINNTLVASSTSLTQTIASSGGPPSPTQVPLPAWATWVLALLLLRLMR